VITTRQPLDAEAYSAYVWYKGRLNDVMWMALGIGFCLGTSLSLGIAMLVHWWTGYSW